MVKKIYYGRAVYDKKEINAVINVLKDNSLSLIDGEKVTFSFRFTNSGDKPLIISNAKGSCGCTVPNYPKEPIAPGNSSYIDVTFDSKGRTGKQSKAVTITANTNPNTKVIRINSEVITE